MPVTPVIKEIFSPHIDDLRTYTPGSASFSIPLELLIGEESREGGDLFYLMVVSSAYISEKVRDSGGLFGRGYLIVPSYSYDQVCDTLSKLCRRSAGATWDNVADKLAQFMEWEFDNYRERGSPPG